MTSEIEFLKELAELAINYKVDGGTPEKIETMVEILHDRIESIELNPAKNELDFLERLSQSNHVRCPEFGHGPIRNWSKERWGLAVAGETGELCNLIKKDIRDGNISPVLIGEEIADIVIYLDMLAQKYGLDLKEIITRKFNQTSHKIGSTVKL